MILFAIFFFGGMYYFHIQDKRYWKNYWIEYCKRDEANNERLLREVDEFVKKKEKKKLHQSRD